MAAVSVNVDEQSVVVDAVAGLAALSAALDQEGRSDAEKYGTQSQKHPGIEIKGHRNLLA